jgi:hypothetical protein
VALDLKVGSKGCKKVTARRDDANSNASTLAVLFVVDSSKCNNEWIILGSVLGALVLIVLIVALVFTFNDRARNCVRPYSKRVEPPT